MPEDQPSAKTVQLQRGSSFRQNIERFSANVQDAVDTISDTVASIPDTVYPSPPDYSLQQTLDALANLGKQTEKPGRRRVKDRSESWITALTNGKLTPKQVILRDEVTFVLMLSNVWLTAYVFGAYPQYFDNFTTVKAVLLLGGRWLLYRTKGWHYYLAEFCYFVITVALVSAKFYPLDPLLHKVTFAMLAGPLTWAVMATGNAFVLHNVDKMTSLFQHMSPALMAYTHRWQPDAAIPGYKQLTVDQTTQFQSATLFELMVLPMVMYLAWAIPYYLFMFVLARKRVQERDYMTMFKLQTKNPSAATTKLIMGAPRPLQSLVYMAIHGTSVWVSVLLTPLWWNSRVAHAGLLIFVALVASWNGASYYFHVFLKRYNSALEELSMKHKATKAT